MLETLLYLIAVEPRIFTMGPKKCALIILIGTLLNSCIAGIFAFMMIRYILAGICPVLFTENLLLFFRCISTVAYYFTLNIAAVPYLFKQLIGWRRQQLTLETLTMRYYIPHLMKAQQ